MRRVLQMTGELDVIERIRRQFRTKSRNVPVGIGDDCAVLRVRPGHEMLVTTDFTLEGRHFRRDLHPPESVGHRCLARGLSDVAAMGATPVAAFLSLALPGEMLSSAAGRRWVSSFFDGLQVLAKRHGVPLAGGDTAESPGSAILADIVLVGSAPRGRALRRSGAEVGDAIYVTGQLGGAAAELASMLERGRRVRARPDGDHPHLFPQPRVEVGEVLLRRRLATAAMDISDGLSTDLAHLCRASGVSAELEEDKLPIHSLARRLGTAAALHSVLHGGEDYELLFTAPAARRMPRSIAGVPITRIGSIIRRRGRLMTLVQADGGRIELKPAGWEHFGRNDSSAKTTATADPLRG